MAGIKLKYNIHKHNSDGSFGTSKVQSKNMGGDNSISNMYFGTRHHTIYLALDIDTYLHYEHDLSDNM